MTTSRSENNSLGQTSIFSGESDYGHHAAAQDIVVRDEQGLVATTPPVETCVLVGVELSSSPGLLPLEDSLAELGLLADTAGLRVVGQMTQKLNTPNPATLIGTGKVEELSMLVQDLGANVVIFDDELSPRQQRELERSLSDDIKVIDRTALILDIFARRAKTREGAVQVELAQYEYRLPRLTRAWTHLARQAGGRAGGASGGVGVRGPGETQLEVDRREINRRIAFLKRQMEQISAQRNQYRQRRSESPTSVVALVGYTNAGKSTMLNALSQAGVLAEDQLFATLDPTTRRVELPSGQMMMLSDTVGFIQKLPTTLVAAFRATLEEVNNADILLHMVDASHPNMDEQIAAVEEVLEELGAGQKTVITALNKVDRIDRNDPAQAARVAEAQNEYPNAVLCSALTGEGLHDLLSKIDEILRQRMMPVEVLIPYEKSRLVANFHQYGLVDHEDHTETGTHLIGRLPIEIAGQLKEYWIGANEYQTTTGN